MKTKDSLSSQIDLKGVITLSSRMRRLSDLLWQQVQDVYDYRERGFKSSWFAILATIQSEGKVDFKTLASRNNVSPSAISQFMNEIEKLKLVKVLKGKDKRSRIITLTTKGDDLLNSIAPDLLDVELAVKELMGENRGLIMDALVGLERELKNRPLLERFQVKIVNYENQYRKDFEKLNLTWLEDNFDIEEYDKELFADPEGIIIKKGGEIFIALHGTKVVGTLALIDHNKSKLEMSKLTVKDDYRHRNIAQMLINRAIEYAKQSSYSEIFALTNSKLEAARALYEKNHFIRSACSDARYRRCNEKFSLKL